MKSPNYATLVHYLGGCFTTSPQTQRTDFNGDGSADNIQFGIKDLIIETSPSAPPFDNEFIGVERFLQEHSRRSNFDQVFCLHYRFTHRDFDGGVLGLAYVAKQGSRGGICQEELNTGIVTTLNYGQRVPPAVTVLTFAHEAGHNFGSEVSATIRPYVLNFMMTSLLHHQHDPEGTDCAPGGSAGNFIMYAFANSGSQPNNDQFSSCSISTMQTFIQSRGQGEGGCGLTYTVTYQTFLPLVGGVTKVDVVVLTPPLSLSTECFADAADVCRNGLLDDGERCDCGIDFDQDTGRCLDDPCCNGTSCQLFGDATCRLP